MRANSEDLRVPNGNYGYLDLDAGPVQLAVFFDSWGARSERWELEIECAGGKARYFLLKPNHIRNSLLAIPAAKIAASFMEKDYPFSCREIPEAEFREKAKV